MPIILVAYYFKTTFMKIITVCHPPHSTLNLTGNPQLQCAPLNAQDRASLLDYQVGQYKNTNTDAAAGTKAQILTQPALPGAGLLRRFWFWSQWYSHL